MARVQLLDRTGLNSIRRRKYVPHIGTERTSE